MRTSLVVRCLLVAGAASVGEAAAQSHPPAAPPTAAPPPSRIDPPILPPPPSVLLGPGSDPMPPPPPVAVVPPPPPPPMPDPAVVPPPPASRSFIELTSLRLMLQHGVISPAEFDSAMRDLGMSIGHRAADSITVSVGKVALTVYGFAQADVMYHSTQSFNDYAGNLQVVRPGTPAGDTGRTEFSARDSRFGFRLKAPELSWLRASALLEMDFLGNAGAIGSTSTEANYFNNPVLRLRHAYLRLETPIVDILFGHTWHLFGWQPNYVPADVQWSGVVGSLFSRSMQLRISKTIKTDPVTLDFAVAGLRPPERDSNMPEFEAGARISFNKWTAVHTAYMTITNTQAASIGVTGDFRSFTLPEFAAKPTTTNTARGMGIAVDAFLPIIRATKEHRDNSLSIVGEFVTGQGINDLYVALNGGVTSPNLPPVAPATTGTPFTANVDAGLAVYDLNGTLRLPQWTTFIVGAEYYLPKVGGRVGLFANVARTQLRDAQQYANPSKVRDNEMFYNGGAFVDLTDAVRIGADYAYLNDTYADGVSATMHMVQAVGFFFF